MLQKNQSALRSRELQIEVEPDHEALSRQAARRILDALANKPDLLLCAAGGGTPARTYKLLVESHSRNPTAFASLRVLKLDEWGGLSMEDPGSCEMQLRTQLVGPLAISEDRYFGFQSDTTDPQIECEKITNYLAKAGPIDLCVLGLGVNGHLGMNEPTPALQPFAHVACLSESSLKHPMLAKSPKQPEYGLTLGIADILAAREILLLVSGANKREPLRRLMRREITTEFPASFMWLHGQCTLLCDHETTDGLDLQK